VRWFLSNGGSESGPYTLDQLRGLASEGKLTPNSKLRDASGQRIIHADQVLGLFLGNDASNAARPVFRQPTGDAVSAHSGHVVAPAGSVLSYERGQKAKSGAGLFLKLLVSALLIGAGVGSYALTQIAKKSAPPTIDVKARLSELETRIARWKSEQIKVQGVTKTLEEDREGLLWQFRRLGVYSPSSANDTPRGQVLLQELRSLTEQLVRLRKKEEEYDLAIFQSESKLRTIERSLATSQVLASEAELAELFSAVSAADAALAAETGASPDVELDRQMSTLLADLEDEQVEGLEWSPEATVVLLDVQPRDLTVSCYDLTGVKIEGSGRYRRALIPDALINREIVFDFLHPNFQTAHRKLTLAKGERVTLAVELTPENGN